MKATESDWELLREYAQGGSDQAFRVLVERYAGMVYHAALRQTSNAHKAQEVTQAVFIALTQKARSISKSVVISGWLFRATRYAVLNIERAERLRRERETEAAVMQVTLSENDPPEAVWEQISPLLDDALDQLSARDREAVLVRYFGDKSHREAAAALGVSEDACKKRLGRALEKLRGIFAKRGVSAPSTALSAALVASAAKTAPGNIASMAAAVALKHAAGGIISSTAIANSILTAMGQARLKVAALAALVAIIYMVQAGRVVAHYERKPQITPIVMATAPPLPPGQIVVWDKNIGIQPVINVSEPTLEQTLDKVTASTDAYWSIDYVIYDSQASLNRLLDEFRTGGNLASCGWTNLCPGPESLGELSFASRSTADSTPVPAALPDGAPPEAKEVVQKGARVLAMTAVLDDDAASQTISSPEKQRAIRDAIDQKLKQGAADGVFSPERLLADINVLPRLRSLANLSPSRDDAERLAAEAHAHWTIIYNLRKSTLQSIAIKFYHPHGLPPPGDNPLLPPTRVQDLESWDSNLFDLTPDEAEAHHQAVQAWLNQTRR